MHSVTFCENLCKVQNRPPPPARGRRMHLYRTQDVIYFMQIFVKFVPEGLYLLLKGILDPHICTTTSLRYMGMYPVNSL